MTVLPLQGLVVLDFSQFLAGPSCSLRLADLGATVVKIEQPGAGDLGRQIYISNLSMDGDSTLFHTINRNKRSLAVDLKNPDDLARVKVLLGKADVMIQNFRPGVIERLGLGYEEVSALCPSLIYGSVTGYGGEGPWRNKPGQDLLAQSVSGLAWLSGDRDDPPTPFGLSVIDMFAGAHLTQGVLACLVRRGVTGRGGHVEVSLLESALDMQFELLTTFLNDGGKPPLRSCSNNGNAYLAAPYGLYQTADGYMALAMAPIPRLAELLNLPDLQKYQSTQSWFDDRDEIKRLLAEELRKQPTAHWLSILEPADVWCAEVLDWKRLVDHEAFRSLQMTQVVGEATDRELVTTRCPVRIDGQILKRSQGAPRVGEHSAEVLRSFGLDPASSNGASKPHREKKETSCRN
jgi:CoA:oxalate CoA-transferase